jgi:hypothetical protein
VDVQQHAPATLSPRQKRQHAQYRTMSGPQCEIGQAFRKEDFLHPLRFKPWNPLVSQTNDEVHGKSDHLASNNNSNECDSSD